MKTFSTIRSSMPRFPTVGRMTRAMVLMTAAAGLAAFSLAAPSYADDAKYGPNLRTILSRDLGPQVGQPGVKDANTVSVVIRATSDISAKLRSLGVNVRSVVSGGTVIITADVPVSILPQVAALAEVQAIDAPTPAAPAVTPAQDVSMKYGANLKTILAQDPATRAGRPGVLDANTLSVVIRARADVSGQLQALGVRIRSSLDGGKLITAEVPIGVLQKVAELPDVIAIDAPVQAGPATNITSGGGAAVAQPVPAPRVVASSSVAVRVQAVGQAQIQGNQITVQTFRGPVTFAITGQTAVRGRGQDVGSANGRLVIVVGRNEGGRNVATEIVVR